MEVVDAAGRPTGAVKPHPHLPMPSGDMRAAELAYPFDIPWAATSANAFRTGLLRRILPIPEAEYPVSGADWYLVHLTALLGPVVSPQRDPGVLPRPRGEPVRATGGRARPRSAAAVDRLRPLDREGAAGARRRAGPAPPRAHPLDRRSRQTARLAAAGAGPAPGRRRPRRRAHARLRSPPPGAAPTSRRR